MNRKLENLIQELALAVINGNEERAERLIQQVPHGSLEKVAYGAVKLFNLALHHLPAITGERIRRDIEEKEKAAAAAKA